MLQAWVQPLVRELRSHMPRSQKKRKEREIWPLSLILFILHQEKELHLGPLQQHSRLEARETITEAAPISSVFILSFWKEGGVGGTQNCTVFSLLLPKCNFRAASIPPPPPRTSQTSSRPPAMCRPCAVSCLALAPLQGGNSSGLWVISCRNLTVHQHPLHLELEIALEFPCTIKSRIRVGVGNLFFFFFL